MKRNDIPIISILLTFLLAALLPIRIARADTYEVTNTNDSGPGSLRQAITDANNTHGPDTITFAAATNGTPITLSGAAGEDTNTSGDLDILAAGDLTIRGNGGANTIIDGGGIDRVFHICPAGHCNYSVSLRGMTIRNGNPGSNAGGGVLHNGASLTILETTIGGVGASNQAQTGGGIHNEVGNITVTKSMILANIADGGGGIYNELGATTMVDDSDIHGNTVFLDGGGLYNKGTLAIINGSTIGEAGASNQADYGAGIFNEAGTTTVLSSTISANTAFDGGGGLFNLTGVITVENSTINGNLASESGGGLGNHDGAIILVNSHLHGNTATNGGGGGIYNNGSLTVENNSSIGGTGSEGNQAVDGGGIYNSRDSTTTVTNSTISGNTATSGNGGGIYNDDTGSLTVDDSTLSANTAFMSGGGVYNDGTLNILNGSTIGGTSAGNIAQNGGGIFINDTDVMAVVSSTISANLAEYGGGIFNRGFSTVAESTINANTADDGGGIYNDTGTTTVTNSRILYNSAATSNGGGLFNDYRSSEATSVTGSCFVGNSFISYFNNIPDQQIATGNWWGAATGPNTPGADTVGGNVNVNGHLTAPILDCTPDIQVGKANDVGGTGTVGIPFHWTLTITNTGLVDGTFLIGQTILEDDLPAGPTYGAPLIGNIVDVTNSTNIFCSVAGNTLSCTAAGANVTLGAEGGRFEVSISAIPAAVGMLVNPTSGGNCWIDPDGNVTETDETNNNCPANVVNVANQTIYLYLPLIQK